MQPVSNVLCWWIFQPSDQSQCASFIISRWLQGLMARYMVGIYCSMPNHVPYLNPHASAPDWLGMDSPDLSSLRCNPKCETSVYCPVILADVQYTITWFLDHNHSHCLKFILLPTLSISFSKPGFLGWGMVHNHTSFTWISSAGPICVTRHPLELDTFPLLWGFSQLQWQTPPGVHCCGTALGQVFSAILPSVATRTNSCAASHRWPIMPSFGLTTPLS